jgi:hypothetical protein
MSNDDALLQRPRNVLCINWDGKGIPYGAEREPRPDGEQNHGFIKLKGRPEALAEVPELVRDKALHDLVATINDPATGLFSIGCVSEAVVDDTHGHRVTGYVEFAFDSQAMVEDAIHYFEVFFHFDQRLRRRGFADRVEFFWELMVAHFHVRTAADGFSAMVTINTHFYETPELARAAWDGALTLFAEHLREIPPQPGLPLV